MGVFREKRRSMPSTHWWPREMLVKATEKRQEAQSVVSAS